MPKELGEKSWQWDGSTCNKASQNCLDLVVTYMNLVRNKVATYQKQANRFTKLSSASSAKLSKQSAFDNVLNQLILAGGGNVSTLTCGASGNNSGECGGWHNFSPRRDGYSIK
jgi:hypothetical protein